jgi:putative DNA primase/helicase
MVAAGTKTGAVVNQLRALMEASTAPRDDRWQARLDDIPRLVDSAAEKLDRPQPVGAEPPAVFDPWERYIVPEFPFHILPPTLQNYVDSQSRAIGCDPSALAMATLAAASGALDHRFAVKQRGGDWWEHPRIWALLVGDPSTKKTPCINAATRPLDQHDAELGRKYKAKLCAYEQAKAAGDNPAAPPDPPVRYVVTDITAEKLGEILSRSDHGILSKRDEISGWIGGMDRYGGGAHKGASDRATWLKAFDGGPYNVRPHQPRRNPCRQSVGQPHWRHPA